MSVPEAFGRDLAKVGVRASFREGLVRSLTAREARGIAGQALLNEFRRGAESGYRWVVGNALEVVADPTMLEELLELARDKRYGADRQMVVLALGRIADQKAVDALVEMLDDDVVAGHAAKALGRLRARTARGALERLVERSSGWIRAEARRTLSKLPS